jgi:hypothetical protein
MKFNNSWLLMLALVLALPGVSFAQNKQFPKDPGVAANGSASVCDGVDGNLVANCGFEQVTAPSPGWTWTGDMSFTAIIPGAPAHSGMLGLDTGPTVDLGFFTQTLATTAGQSYDLTYWLRNNGRPARFQISWDGSVIQDDPAFDHPDHAYTSYTIPGLIASTDGTVLSFGFFNVPDFFWFDDVIVTVSPAGEK